MTCDASTQAFVHADDHGQGQDDGDSNHAEHKGGQREMLNEPNRGQVRTNIVVCLSSALHDQSRNREVLCPR